MSSETLYGWHEGELTPVDEVRPDDGGQQASPRGALPAETTLEAADSWLVTNGRALALDLHRQRFGAAIAQRLGATAWDGHDLDAFWRAALDAIPREGDWFPRVELRSTPRGSQLVYRERAAPPRERSLALATHHGPDPRTAPTIKGPDLEAMARLRTSARARGADDAVLIDAAGHLIEGTTTALLWWEGDSLFSPSPELARIDSVTARCVIGIAFALGVDVRHARVRPADLEGRELWAVNALHGIRIVTRWVDGPPLAAEPGRLHLWRDRLDALRTVQEGPA